MENRIDVLVSAENKESIFQALKGIKSGLPYLVKLSEDDRKSLQKIDDGRKPFVQKCLELALKNNDLDPGSELLKEAAKDVDLYIFLASVESELHQLLDMVTDTKQVAGSEAYEVARFIYMKAKMNVKMGIPGSQAIVDDLCKLYKVNYNITKLKDLQHP
ncbi:MAG: hypothetical protein WCJ95_12385 [Mariniphaga sp.]